MSEPAGREHSLDWGSARVAASAVSPVAPTALPLAEALGGVLAEPLWARAALPPFDTAAMDGYAVRGRPPWRVVGRVLAGDPLPGPLRAGEAVEVATGSGVPDGADGVVPAERAVRSEDELAAEPPRGAHVRRRGEECPALTALLPAGTVVTPGVLGLAAAVGCDDLVVRRVPPVRLAVTGAELLERGLPGDGRVRDALGPALPGVLAALGVAGVLPERVGDDRAGVDALLAGLTEAPVGSVLVTTGASSRGPADHLRPALVVAGARLLVPEVACRPGHPMLLAALPGGGYVVGLPGNPLAALAAVVTLLAPLLAGLTGRARDRGERCRVGAPVAGSAGTTVLLPVRRRDGVALPTGHARAGMVRGAALADGMAVLPPGASCSVGDPVRVHDLPGAARD